MTRVPVLTEREGRAEIVALDVDDSEASLAGRYWSTGYTRFLETGEVKWLDPFVGKPVGGLPLVTDPDLIEDFYEGHGHVDFREYYKP